MAGNTGRQAAPQFALQHEHWRQLRQPSTFAITNKRRTEDTLCCGDSSRLRLLVLRQPHAPAEGAPALQFTLKNNKTAAHRGHALLRRQQQAAPQLVLRQPHAEHQRQVRQPGHRQANARRARAAGLQRDLAPHRLIRLGQRGRQPRKNCYACSPATDC